MRAFLNGLSVSNTPQQAYANRFIIAVTVTFAAVLELLDTSIVNVAIPHMMGSLGATLDEVAWVSTGYVVANVIVLPISGWLSNYFGRRAYFAGSILVFTLASIACGNATSLGGLVFWRIVQGLGGGGLLATAQATLYEVFTPKEAAISMAIFGLGIMVGPMLGPTLGGYLTDTLSWPWIFYINVPLGILTLLATLMYVPDSRFRTHVSQVDWLGLLLLTLGVGALQLMLERGERLGWLDSGEVTLYACCSALALSGFVWRELSTDHPIVDLRIMADPQFSAALVFAFLLGIALYSTVFMFPVYLQTLLGYTAWQTGLVVLIAAVASGVSMGVISRVVGNRLMDPRIPIGLGCVLYIWAMVLHSRFTDQSGMADFVFPLILRGMSFGIMFVPLSNLAMARLPLQRVPNASGLYNLTRQLGGSIGIAGSASLFVAMQDRFRAGLVENVAHHNPLTAERLEVLRQIALRGGAPDSVATTQAWAMLDGQISRQAATLAFENLFLYLALALALAAPLLLLMRDTHAVRGNPDAGH